MQTNCDTPILRAALLAALASPNHTLRRAKGGFAATGIKIRTSSSRAIAAFTRRAVNKLQREGLVEFDNEGAPSEARLTSAGVEVATQLQAAQA